MSSMNLKEIFDSITPENIKNIPLIQNAMDIFIDKLEEHSQIATDIRKMWDNIPEKAVVGGRQPDSKIVADSKNKLRGVILDTYVAVLKEVVEHAQRNQLIYNKFERDGITNSPLTYDVVDIINNEYAISNKQFNEKVGTETGIRYAYNFAQYLEGKEYTDDMVLTDIRPFFYNIQGSIYHEMYEGVVKPLAHPLGFCYSYEQVVYDFITDYYGIDTIYDFNAIEVRQIDGYFDVYTPDTTDQNTKLTFLTDRINPLTNETFTLDEYKSQVRVFTNKIADEYIDSLTTEGYRMVIFTDGICLINYSDGRVVHCLYSEWLKNNNNPKAIKQYSDHASLYLEYTTDFTFEYYDEFMMVQEFVPMVDDYGTTSFAEPVPAHTALDDSNFDINTAGISGVYFYTPDGYYLNTSDNSLVDGLNGCYLYAYDNDDE